jgi:peptidoglycan hydrolase CwlO-like protein
MNTIEQLRAQIRHLERDIEDKQGEICTAQSNIETFEYSCTDDEYDEMLDEIEGSIAVAGMEFFPSDILKSCDPVAYRCAKNDFESDYDLDNCEEYKDLKDELEALEEQLSDLENELDELNSEIDSLENDE